MKLRQHIKNILAECEQMEQKHNDISHDAATYIAIQDIRLACGRLSRASRQIIKNTKKRLAKNKND